MDNNIIHIDCACGSPEHILRYSWDDCDEDLFDGHLYTSVQLRQWRNPFHRLWVAIKYVFGYESRYGHWDCTMMESGEIKKLVDFLQARLAELEVSRARRIKERLDSRNALAQVMEHLEGE